MKDNQPNFCKLVDIAKWQLDEKNASVGLPALQRGYVWRPKQVETLWDSLLRGFPIGSFLISENGDHNLKNDLLDGQQRATAITMGFYNPWEQIKHPNFFSKKFKDNPEETVPVLWLDLGYKEDQGDFIFMPRLITQSHPWGFNRNSAPLGIASRRAANEYFEKSGNKYPHYNLKNVYPWDADLPIPMCFLIETMDLYPGNWREKITEKSIEYLSHIKLKNFDESNETTAYISKLQTTLNDKNISEKIEQGVKTLWGTQIPIITLANKHISKLTH